MTQTHTRSKSGHVRIVEKRIAELRHPEVNEKVYRPIRTDDPEVVALSRSIERYGVKEPLIVSLDNYIISGNRRATAARLAGLETVPVIVEPIIKSDPMFLGLLVEANRQRHKTPDEIVRESIIEVSADDAHRKLIHHRKAKVWECTAESLSVEIEGQARRAKITKNKMPMLTAALKVINERREFWPLTTRQVHYGLLNDPPSRHAKKSDSRYANDDKSYKDLCDLLSRARHEGLLSWDAIDDPTRPVDVWRVHPGVGPFVRDEMRNLMRGYWRDLQQGQPLHIEIVGEKNTIGNIIRPVAADYCIPLTLGRGYCSNSPRKKMADRFKRSGRETMALLMLGDFDPEGEDITQAFARSIRDEFGVDVKLVKVALTAAQVEEMKLPSMMKAKDKSSRRKKFVERHGETVHELEAVPPQRLQELLRGAIESVMDVPTFNRQQELEKEDALSLERIRRRLEQAASGLFDDENESTAVVAEGGSRG